MKVEVDVLGSPSLISVMVSVDLKEAALKQTKLTHHTTRRYTVTVRGLVT